MLALVLGLPGLSGPARALGASGEHRPSVTGVDRTATLPDIPSLTCVRRVLETMPELALAEPLERGGSDTTSLLEKFTQPPDTRNASVSYPFIYAGPKGSQIRGALIIEQLPGDVPPFLQQGLVYQPYLQYPPAQQQAEVDATRPVMAHIERRLEAECGMGGLTSRVQEECSGVQCAPLPAPGSVPLPVPVPASPPPSPPPVR